MPNLKRVKRIIKPYMTFHIMTKIDESQNHHSLAVADLKRKKVMYIDSLQSPGNSEINNNKFLLNATFKYKKTTEMIEREICGFILENSITQKQKIHRLL